jgi:adenylyl-sulfate kinase
MDLFSTSNNKAVVLWFSGLSGSGKTTIALSLKDVLVEKGKKVDILDGDVVRGLLNRRLGFSRNDIRENNMSIAKLASKRLADYDLILVPIIAPYNEDRIMAKNIIGSNNFIEIFIKTPLEQCIKRDPKGLYKKALNGEINNFIGICDKTPYEEPSSPDIIIETTKLSIVEAVNSILDNLKYT